MTFKCPCRELDELREYRQQAKQQIADMQTDMVILARRNAVCGAVFDSVKEENKRLREELANSAKVVRCASCKHYGDEYNENGRVHHFCKLHKGLVVVNKNTFCSYGEVANE